MKKNQKHEDTIKEHVEHIAQLKARVQELEAGDAGAKAGRPVLKARPHKSVVNFDMDMNSGDKDGE